MRLSINYKKATAMTAAVVMMTTAIGASAYTDTDGTEYADSVNLLAALDITVDDGDMFYPEAPITRAEMTALTARAMGWQQSEDTYTSLSFTDVPADYWAYSYISWAESMEYANGYGDGRFGPDDTATYNQAVKLVTSALGYYMDAMMNGGYSTGYNTIGLSLELLNGIAKSADEELTKGEAAAIIANALEAPMNISTGTVIDLWGNPIYNFTTMNGTGKYFESPATRFFGVYTLEGKFTNTSATSDELEDGEAEFTINYSRNFDGEFYDSGSDASLVLYPNEGIDADELLGISVTVYVQRGDSGEWRVIAVSA